MLIDNQAEINDLEAQERIAIVRGLLGRLTLLGISYSAGWMLVRNGMHFCTIRFQPLA